MKQSRTTLMLCALLVVLGSLWSRSLVSCGHCSSDAPSEASGDRLTGSARAVASERSERQHNASAPDGSERPYVLLIGIETLRADHVGCLGYPRTTTPTLDAIAKEGVAFSKAMATESWTMPTVMSVLTSLYPEVHQTTGYDRTLPEGIVTLAEVLKESGYQTAAFVSNPTLDGRHGFCQGFELYDDFSAWLDFVGLGKPVAGDGAAPNPDVHKALTNEPLTRAALAWLERHYNQPFFMFMFYFDSHYDYIPPPPFDTMFDPDYDGSIDGRGIVEEPRRSHRPAERDLDHIMALYDGEVRYTDTCISRLLKAFARLGILDQTLVVVFGDHGDEFYEHGGTGHAHTLYNELLHIPLMFRWPSRIAPRTSMDALVSQVDIMPTILDYLGIRNSIAMQGASLKDLIEGRVTRAHEFVFAGGSASRCAVVGDAGKMLLNHKAGVDGEFYDLLNDHREQSNLHQTAGVASLMASFERQFERWASENRRLTVECAQGSDSGRIQLDENRLRQLKALGYAQ